MFSSQAFRVCSSQRFQALCRPSHFSLLIFWIKQFPRCQQDIFTICAMYCNALCVPVVLKAKWNFPVLCRYSILPLSLYCTAEKYLLTQYLNFIPSPVKSNSWCNVTTQRSFWISIFSCKNMFTLISLREMCFSLYLKMVALKECSIHSHRKS